MKLLNHPAQLVLMLLLALALAACGSTASSTAPTNAAPQTAAPTSAPEPTAAPQPTTAPTAAPEPTAVPTTAAQLAPAGGLTDDEVLKALNATFATFPRRQRTTVILKKDNTTSTAMAEIESADRIRGSQEINGQLYEAVVISPTLYLKTPQGWQQQNDPGMLQLFSMVTNPGALLKSSGFQELLAALKKSKSAYKLIGAEQIGGVQTQIYQYEVHSSAINATYTFWLGADGRFYKLESESERFKTSTVMEFDPSIKITAP